VKHIMMFIALISGAMLTNKVGSFIADMGELTPDANGYPFGPYDIPPGDDIPLRIRIMQSWVREPLTDEEKEKIEGLSDETFAKQVTAINIKAGVKLLQPPEERERALVLTLARDRKARASLGT